MHRAIAIAAAAIAAALAACDESERETCPGEPVATLSFDGERALLGDPALDGLDPEPAVADCSDGKAADGTADLTTNVGHPDALAFDATLSAAGAQTAALCEPDGTVLFGSRSGTRFFVETGTSGAVLGDCSPTCSARMRLVVTGDLIGGGAEPASFQGLVVEILTYVAGDCRDCLPVVPGTEPAVRACAARYKVPRTP